MKQKLKHLKDVWVYSDGQPTEVILGSINIILTPIAVYLELCGLGIFQLFLIASGIYQLMCVAGDDIKCRLRASFLTFSMYMATLIMYLGEIGLPTASHYGWIVLTFAAFSSLIRIKKEQLHRL